jgi:hypothetical protein
MANQGAVPQPETGMVFINLGRGPVVDSDALITTLTTGPIRVPRWTLHSARALPAWPPTVAMDSIARVATVIPDPRFIHATGDGFFVTENLPRFMRGEPLLNQLIHKLVINY